MRTKLAISVSITALLTSGFIVNPIVASPNDVNPVAGAPVERVLTGEEFYTEVTRRVMAATKPTERASVSIRVQTYVHTESGVEVDPVTGNSISGLSFESWVEYSAVINAHGSRSIVRKPNSGDTSRLTCVSKKTCFYKDKLDPYWVRLRNTEGFESTFWTNPRFSGAIPGIEGRYTQKGDTFTAIEGNGSERFDFYADGYDRWVDIGERSVTTNVRSVTPVKIVTPKSYKKCYPRWSLFPCHNKK